MVGSFNRLPLEVLTNILSYAPDLLTIYKFICSSTHINAAFNIELLNILDAANKRSIPEFKHSARIGHYPRHISIDTTSQLQRSG